MTEKELREIAFNAISNNKGKKIKAVNEFRAKTLFSLKDSKFYVEKYQKEVDEKEKKEVSYSKPIRTNDDFEPNQLFCMRCKSLNVTRKQVGKNNSGWLWPIMIVSGVLGISINPLIILLAILVGFLNLLVNFVERKRDQKKWLMVCNTCNNEFYIDAIK